jgi:multicomponent Na+:H+ antiporter subunit F
MSLNILLPTILLPAMILVCILTLFCGYRAFVGPTIPDRVIGLDAIGTNITAIAVLLAFLTGFDHFILIALVLAIIGFITTVAAANYFSENEVIQ